MNISTLNADRVAKSLRLSHDFVPRSSLYHSMRDALFTLVSREPVAAISLPPKEAKTS